MMLPIGNIMGNSRHKLGILLLICVTVPACFAQAISSDTTADNLFDFHSGFWINLHHFLYRQALLSTSQSGLHRLALTQADSDAFQRLSMEERGRWEAAVAYYKTSMVDHDLLFDQSMGAIKNALEDAESSPDLANVQIPIQLKNALLAAAPSYKKYWWTTHNTQNQQWVNELKPLVNQYGLSISNALAAIYEEPWPQYPVRADVVAYANWAGAYTTLEPTRLTISSTDAANQGTAALEIVFHEASHGMMQKVLDAFRAAETNAKANGKIFHSGSLWHAILFYTAGELVAEQVPGYAPYADKNGLWTRAWPAPDHALIEQDWKPHLEGRVSLSGAIDKLVEDLASTSQHK